VSRRLFVLATALLSASPAFADDVRVSPETGGVVVVATASTAGDDLRLGRIAARFAARGLESFVAGDCVRPPPDPERGLVHGRWRLDDARRSRRMKRLAAAAAAGDEAIRVIEQHAYEKQHLELLVEALIERGATALEVGDPATAETVFLKALALDPFFELDAELYPDPTPQVFNDVRRASRELRFGSLRVEVPELNGAQVAIDFGSPQDVPLTVSLPDGRHFVSVSAPMRHEVVAIVPVRAERETMLALRPPISGDARERAVVLSTFRVSDPRTTADLARSTGMRFVVAVDGSSSGTSVAMYDGKSGAQIAGTDSVLSPDPGVDEIDAAVTRMISAAMLIEPALDPENLDRSSWYSTWWGVTLIGVAAAGVAAGTFAVLQATATGRYEFEQR
jgi:hypothetical protein